MAKMDEKFPNLDEYMEEKKRHLVSYAEGARMYQIPYYSFVRLAKEAGATEELKVSDPMKWVGLMNTCKAQAEEILMAELINS